MWMASLFLKKTLAITLGHLLYNGSRIDNKNNILVNLCYMRATYGMTRKKD